MKTAIQLIEEERRRQIFQEGWTPAHDDSHKEGELALAAMCYAMPDECRSEIVAGQQTTALWYYWPFEFGWWKETPEDRVRELVKAGALIAAEIDRLNRIEA